jgi:hypothetical protein
MLSCFFRLQSVCFLVFLPVAVADFQIKTFAVPFQNATPGKLLGLQQRIMIVGKYYQFRAVDEG